VVDDIKINGKLTLGEDVADLGGTDAGLQRLEDATAGRSWNRSAASRRSSVSSSAWRSGIAATSAPRSKRANAITNPHSPDEYRINGVVSNMPEFARRSRAKRDSPWCRAAGLPGLVGHGLACPWLRLVHRRHDNAFGHQNGH
jgi:putative endopeptidase